MPRPCPSCGRRKDKDHRAYGGCALALSLTGRLVHRDRLKEANELARSPATRGQTLPWHRTPAIMDALERRSILGGARAKTGRIGGRDA